MPYCDASGADTIISVNVQPKAAKTEFVLVDGALKLRVNAPPVDGAANKAVIEAFARALEIPKSRVSVKSGQTSRQKRILAEGIDPKTAETQIEEFAKKGKK